MVDMYNALLAECFGDHLTAEGLFKNSPTIWIPYLIRPEFQSIPCLYSVWRMPLISS